jgi:hypothetical protein
MILINSVKIIEKALDFDCGATDYVVSGPWDRAGTTSLDGTGDRDLEPPDEPLFPPPLLLLTPPSPCGSGGPGTAFVVAALIAPKIR